VQEANYHTRDNALDELRAAIHRVLQPAYTVSYTGGVTVKHFLKTPKPPLGRVNKAGKVEEPDPELLDAFHEELAVVNKKERELERCAQKAKNLINPLLKWGQALGEREDWLLLAGSILDEEDRPDVESYIREHRRFLRTANAWTDKLRF
jgi:hypothetical protein